MSRKILQQIDTTKVHSLHRVGVLISIVLLLLAIYNFITVESYKLHKKTVLSSHHEYIRSSEGSSGLAENTGDTLFQCKAHSLPIDLTSHKKVSSFRTGLSTSASGLKSLQTPLELKALAGVRQYGFDPITGKNVSMEWKPQLFLRQYHFLLFTDYQY